MPELPACESPALLFEVVWRLTKPAEM